MSAARQHSLQGNQPARSRDPGYGYAMGQRRHGRQTYLRPLNKMGDTRQARGRLASPTGPEAHAVLAQPDFKLE